MGDIVTKNTSKKCVRLSLSEIILHNTTFQDSLESNEAVPKTNVDIDILFGPNPIGHCELGPS